MTLHGAVKTSQGNGTEMLSSALASLGAEPLACRQREPIPLSNQPVTFEGQPLQHVKPSDLWATKFYTTAPYKVIGLFTEDGAIS